MLVHNQPHRTIEPLADGSAVRIIDQTWLPWQFTLIDIDSWQAMAIAIKEMQVRGAPLIGAAAAFGLALGLRESGDDAQLTLVSRQLAETRPTAINLRWALEEMRRVVAPLPAAERADAAWAAACRLADDDVASNRRIAEHGLPLIAAIHQRTGQPVQLLTHCNAGWLATVDWGTALAPIYLAQQHGIPLHVWVDETRPRNQGAALTAWELGAAGIPHTLVADNTGGHLMQHGLVDAVIVGADRVTRRGDVCNKIGTYLKALAARDNQLPFWVALPASTIDWTLDDGIADIPIEERSGSEVSHITGWTGDQAVTVRISPEATPTANYAFDVTPARLVEQLITDRGCFSPSELWRCQKSQ